MSLDTLKKEAKRWLRALRAGDPDARTRFERAHPKAPSQPGLRDVQFALARERGFAGWTDLKAAVAARATVESDGAYEQMAVDLVAAHDFRDAVALERLGRHYRRTLTQEDVRAEAWGRVYALRQRAAESGERRLELVEAREMIAREEGFGNWAALIDAKRAGRPAPGRAYQIDRVDSVVSARRVLVPAEWEDLLAHVNEERITGLEASTGMTDAILGRVSELDHVTTLRLEGARQLTDEGLQQLARMPQLVELDLSGCVVTDRALEVLRHLPNLRRFHMRWQGGITDAGVANLASCEQLESVDLMGTHTGDGAIRALADKPGLRRFKSGRLVTDAGLTLLHQFPVFKTWQGGEMKYSLMESEVGPNQLLLDGPFTDAGVASLAGLDGLFGLGFFWHAKAITSRALASLAGLPNLGFLSCEGELCDDTAMRSISAIPRLRMLLAQGTVATDDGFVALSRSRTLEYLWGRECPNLTGRGFAALSTMPALRGLGVSCKGVDDDALATLPQFPVLRELMPMDVHDEGFRHVGGCRQLETLWCMYCRETTDAATEQIGGLNLKTYYAGKTKITDRSLAILAEMSSLEKVMFWETEGITDDGVRLLKRLPRLRELSLEGLPNVTSEAIREFLMNVRVNHAP
jgi:hypothetical protein